MQLETDVMIDDTELIQETWDDFDIEDPTDEDFSDTEKDVITLMRNIDEQTEESIRRFFSDKKWHCGGDIPEHELVSRDKMDVCEQLDLESAIGLFYCYINDYVAKNPSFQLGGVSLYKRPNYDCTVCRNTLDDCAFKKVPKNRAGGILLMYLSLVAGIPIDWSVLSDKVREISGCRVVSET